MITVVNELFERVVPSKKQAEASISLLQEKISQELTKTSVAVEKRARSLKAVLDHFQHVFKDWANQGFEEASTWLASHTFADLDARKAMCLADDSVRVFGPPYDMEFKPGVYDDAFTDTKTGEFHARFGEHSESVGMGIHVCAAKDMNVRVTAYLPIYFSWATNRSTEGFANTSGSIAVVIQDIEDQDNIVGNSSELFNHSLVTPGFVEDKGTLTYLSNTGCAETYITMRAGHNYSIVFFCFGKASYDGFYAFSTSNIVCKMPFIVLKPQLL